MMFLTHLCAQKNLSYFAIEMFLHFWHLKGVSIEDVFAVVLSDTE